MYLLLHTIDLPCLWVTSCHKYYNVWTLTVQISIQTCTKTPVTEILFVHVFRSIAQPLWVKMWISQPKKESREDCCCELQLEISSVSSNTNHRWGCDSQSLGHIWFGSSALLECQCCSCIVSSSSRASLSLHNKHTRRPLFITQFCVPQSCVCVRVSR